MVSMLLFFFFFSSEDWCYGRGCSMGGASMIKMQRGD